MLRFVAYCTRMCFTCVPTINLHANISLRNQILKYSLKFSVAGETVVVEVELMDESHTDGVMAF